MSFTFKWPRFSDQFHEEAKEMLHAALNKGSKPPIIADKIEVVELEMGTEPPELEIKDIGQLTKDQFRGIFKLTYAGDAFIVLRTKVQANPLNHRKKNEMSDLLGGSAGILAAHQPLVVPMLLRLSQFRLNSYVVLVLSKQKGCTLVFKTDPLQNVEVSSTFDSIAVIQSFIQTEIEEQLREMFREDLPSIIHRLSQRWVAGQTRVEAPYLLRAPAPVPAPPPRASTSPLTSTRSLPGAPSSSYSRRNRRRDEPLSPSIGMVSPAASIGLQPGLHPPSAFGRSGSSSLLQRTRSRVSAPASSSIAPPSSYTPPSDRASARSGTKTPLSSDFPINPLSSLPDIENFDPTYGLRPEGLPLRSGYSGLGRLFEASKGLRDLADGQSPRDVMADMEGESAYDVVEWEDDLHGEEEEEGTQIPHAAYDDVDDEPVHPEYVDMETIPAVGGGFITRPRVYQSKSSSSSIVQTPSSLSSRGAQTQGYREGKNPKFSRAQGERLISQGRSRARRAGPSTHRDRGIAMGGGEGSYNPYFGDAIYNSGRSPGQQINPEGEDEFGMTSSHSNHLRRSTAVSATSKTIPMDVGTSSSGLRGLERDRQRSISRSPPYTESFPFGPSSSPHQRHFAGSTSDDPDAEFGTMNGDYSGSGHGRTNSRGIILRNQSVSQLTALSRSNQTLSPYTRSFSHFTVRSGPPKPVISNTTPFTFTSANNKRGGPAKARRKRIHRLGLGSGDRKAKVRTGGHYDGKDNSLGDGEERGGEDDGRERERDVGHYSPPPPSEFSDEDVEHYFRTRRPSEVL